MIRFRPAAARELAADYRFYEKDHPGRGVRFVHAVDAALAQVERSPMQFAVLYDPDIRLAKVTRFPYRVGRSDHPRREAARRIVYVVIDDVIDVVAVAHAKRRPGYWRRRIK